MPLKAIGFVDGNNFYHLAKKSGLDYQQVDFPKMIKHICKEKKWDYKGFYYYNSIPRQSEDKEAYFAQLAYFDRVKKMDKNLGVISRKLRYASAKEILDKYTRQKEKLATLSLCDTCLAKVDPCCFGCVIKKRKREKGIDVKIAVDIIQKAISGEFDVCILISGDADFVPALQLIQEKYGKKPFSLFIRCKGYSWELRQNIEHYTIEPEEFDNFLIIP